MNWNIVQLFLLSRKPTLFSGVQKMIPHRVQSKYLFCLILSRVSRFIAKTGVVFVAFVIFVIFVIFLAVISVFGVTLSFPPYLLTSEHLSKRSCPSVRLQKSSKWSGIQAEKCAILGVLKKGTVSRKGMKKRM